MIQFTPRNWGSKGRVIMNKGRVIKNIVYRVRRSTIFHSIFISLLLIYVLIIVPYARIEKMVRKGLGRKPRIVWGTSPILSIRHSSYAARLMGYKSDTLVYTKSILDEEGQYDYVMDNLVEKYASAKGLLGKITLGLMSPFVFMWATLKYDIFHMYFVGGILWPFFQSKLEIPLLHLAGKKVIVVPFGDDARLKSEALKFKDGFCQHCDGKLYNCDEPVVRKRVEYFCKHSDMVLECAETVGYFPRSDGMWMYPINDRIWQPTEVPDNKGVVKVVHSSNHRVLKGTDLLVEAVEELKGEGYDIELVIVEKMTNNESKTIYETADIIADQFFAGAYALFAIEGMALGKPVMCFISDEYLPWHPEWLECPIYNTSQYDIKDRLRELVLDKELRLELGRKGIEYVEKYHGLRAIGEKLDELYRRIW